MFEELQQHFTAKSSNNSNDSTIRKIPSAFKNIVWHCGGSIKKIVEL